jgi:hypothetical protein
MDNLPPTNDEQNMLSQSATKPVPQPKSPRNLILLLVIMLLLSTGAGAYYLRMSRRSTPPSQTTIIPTSIPSPTPNQSSPINDQNVNVKGYYKQYQGLDWGNIKVACDSLLVTGGNEQLIQGFKDGINNGNTINAFDENKNLLMNIEIPEDEEIAQKIKNSTSSNQIELTVHRKEEEGRGVNKCYSFVNIISAQ